MHAIGAWIILSAQQAAYRPATATGGHRCRNSHDREMHAMTFSGILCKSIERHLAVCLSVHLSLSLCVCLCVSESVSVSCTSPYSRPMTVHRC